MHLISLSVSALILARVLIWWYIESLDQFAKNWHLNNINDYHIFSFLLVFFELSQQYFQVTESRSYIYLSDLSLRISYFDTILHVYFHFNFSCLLYMVCVVTSFTVILLNSTISHSFFSEDFLGFWGWSSCYLSIKVCYLFIFSIYAFIFLFLYWPDEDLYKFLYKWWQWILLLT